MDPGSRTVEAIYEHGVFRPLEPMVGIEEQVRVRLTIKRISRCEYPFAVLIGSLPKEDAEEMKQIIDQEFERVDPREW